MSNNWKYSTLGQRDKLKMIKNGNSDVYNTEKKLNSNLRNVQKVLGISTEDVDNWDSIIDDAFEKSAKKTNDNRSGLPKFMSDKESRLFHEYNNFMKQLKKDTERSVDTALSDAEKDSEYLDEFLSGLGYSKKGSMSKKEHDEIRDGLARLLDSIARNFETKSKSAKEDYLSKMRSLD